MIKPLAPFAVKETNKHDEIYHIWIPTIYYEKLITMAA